MRPTRKLLKIMAGFAAAGGFIFSLRLFNAGTDQAINYGQSNSDSFITYSWWLALAVMTGLILVDWWFARKTLNITCERKLPHSLALGVYTKVALQLENNSSRHLSLQLTEQYNNTLECTALPLSITIGAGSQKNIQYAIVPMQRGLAEFNDTLFRITSSWGFWLKSQRIHHNHTVKIYPNFAPIAQSANVSLEHHIAQMGIHLQQRRGEGSDFHQLREFREGDAMRQIDWNATSRYHKPVSRDYQDERDQDVFFLIDCGRRLRGKEDELSFFDHALNAVLLTSYIALRQGDGVGLMTFGAEQQRWLSPLKHPARINTIMNQLFDVQSTTQASDYLEAAQQFLMKRKKRALVIMITNVREEDVDDLKEATRLLSRKHMVMVASLRDRYFEEKTQAPILNLQGALSYCAVVDYLKKRHAVLTKLKNLGAVITDSLPSQLHLKLVQEYLKLKRSGRF